MVKFGEELTGDMKPEMETEGTAGVCPVEKTGVRDGREPTDGMSGKETTRKNVCSLGLKV